MTTVSAWAPGRVNLIGDHTDYTGGLVLPMAIDRGTEVELERGVPWVELVSADEDEPAFIDFADPRDPSTVQPVWARYVAGVVHVLAPDVGGIGFVRSDLPIGAGLSSSAALEVAVALALGFEGSPRELALVCQQAEQVASGVPCGIMDQLASVLVDVLGRLDRLFDEPMPYMLWVHQRPVDGGEWPAAHLHVHVAPLHRAPCTPRFVAAGELGSGVWFDPVVPEEAAAALRAAGP